MNKLLALVVLALPVTLAGCICDKTEARFWEVKDSKSGVMAFTVDTAKVTAYSIDTKYVDASGQYVTVEAPAPVRQMTEAEWLAATGGASYGLLYCGMRKACWASVSAR